MHKNNFDGKKKKQIIQYPWQNSLDYPWDFDIPFDQSYRFRILEDPRDLDQSSYHIKMLNFVRILIELQKKDFRKYFDENFYVLGLGKKFLIDRHFWVLCVNYRYKTAHTEGLFNYRRTLTEEEKKYNRSIQNGLHCINSIITPHVKMLFTQGKILPEKDSGIKSIMDFFLIASYKFCRLNFMGFLLNTYFADEGAIYNIWKEEQKWSKIVFCLLESLPKYMLCKLGLCNFDVSLLDEGTFFCLFCLLIATMPCFLFVVNQGGKLIPLRFNITKLDDFNSLYYSTYSMNYEKDTNFL